MKPVPPNTSAVRGRSNDDDDDESADDAGADDAGADDAIRVQCAESGRTRGVAAPPVAARCRQARLLLARHSTRVSPASARSSKVQLLLQPLERLP